MKNDVINKLTVSFPAIPSNEGLARSVSGIFLSQMNPTIEELADVKCAVSEAVTNSIVHGYKASAGIVEITMKQLKGRIFRIDITDKGCGIENIEMALEPLFTTDPESERSGMGFSIMESFMDTLSVKSSPGKGCKVTMTKKLTSTERVSDLTVHK